MSESTVPDWILADIGTGKIDSYAERVELLPDGRVLISGQYFGTPMPTYTPDGKLREIVYADDAVEIERPDNE